MKSVTGERSFSEFKRIKAYFRKTMVKESLTTLAIIHIEKDIDLDNFIDQFGKQTTGFFLNNYICHIKIFVTKELIYNHF